MKTKLLITLIIALFVQTAFSQEKAISGIVTGNTGPIPGAVVYVQGGNNAATDLNGRYSIKASAGDILNFSYVGHESTTVTIASSNIYNVTLEPSNVLEEIVVTALGIKKSTKAIGYSLTEVKGKELSAVKSVNAINALQGKVAGVNITSNATGAGGSSRVIIRGNTSLTGNNQPLYIVDGIPIGNDNNGSAKKYGGTDGGDGISSINPDDIASVSVLKGGAAAALYGYRAANGVILITTKTGSENRGLSVEINSALTFDQVLPLLDFQDKYGQGTLGTRPVSGASAFENPNSSWGEKLDGKDTPNWDGESRPYSDVGDNVRKFYNTGVTYTNTVSISDAKENLNYRFSMSDLSNEDIVPNSGIDRNTFSLNLNSTLADQLTLITSVKYTKEKAHNRPRLSDASGNANYTVFALPANVDVTTMDPGNNPDGTEKRISDNAFQQNPYWSAYNFRNEDTKNRIIASGSLKYDIKDWLYLTGRAGIDEYSRRATSVEPWGTAYKLEGGMTEQEKKYTEINSDLILGVNKELSGSISTNSFVGIASNNQIREELTLTGDDFVDKGFLESVKSTGLQSHNYSFGQKKINSVFGSAEISYNNYWYLTFTARNDWFSTLSYLGKETPNDDLYTSINTSYIVSESIELPSWVNFAKLRLGYSQLAGGAPNPYSLNSSYQIGQKHNDQFLAVISGDDISNPNLVPYSINEFEIGADLRMFGGLLSIDAAYYNKNTLKDIVGVNVSQGTGYRRKIINVGEINNKGLELLVSSTPIKTADFSWNTSINFAYNKSTVVKTDEHGNDISLGEGVRTENVQIQHIQGENYGVIYGRSFVRTDDGSIVYDIDDEGVPRPKNGNNKVLGNGIAPISAGFNNSFSYKNINLSFLLDSKFGGQIYSGTNAAATSRGQHKSTLEGREQGLTITGIDAETVEETKVTINGTEEVSRTGTEFTSTIAPKDLSTYYGRLAGIAENFVYDADYIKIAQISFSYSFPSKMLEKTFLTSASIAFVARNLFYLYNAVENIAPESAYNTTEQGLEYFGVPATRNYGISLNIKF